jgi:hypothetical protein
MLDRRWFRECCGKEYEVGDSGENEREDERELLADVVADAEVAILWICSWRASCWECKRRYFCSAKARSGDFWRGLPVIDIFSVLASLIPFKGVCFFCKSYCENSLSWDAAG